MREEFLKVAESPMVQIATIAESMPGSLKLCYGESDLPTPSFICDALTEAALAGHTFYTHTAGYHDLRQAIAEKVFELHRVRYEVPEIMASVGGTMAIYAAIRAFVGRGDNAVIVSPAYAIFSNAVIMAGGEPRFASLALHENRFVLDLDRVRAAIDAHTRMLIVNSPSNPTGWVISQQEQRALAEMAERHDLVILADEVYERLIYENEPKGSLPQGDSWANEPKGSLPQGNSWANEPKGSLPQGNSGDSSLNSSGNEPLGSFTVASNGRSCGNKPSGSFTVASNGPSCGNEPLGSFQVAPSFARVVTNRDRLIVINSFSKTYNMTGWRLGWAQSSERIIKTMYKAAEFITSNPTAMVQRAGIVALRDGEPHIAGLREQYAQRRDQVKTALQSIPGVTLPVPQGAFYAFPKFDFITDSAAFTAELVRKTGVALAPGVGFGRDGEGYIRVCFASTEATVREALARLRSFAIDHCSR